MSQKEINLLIALEFLNLQKRNKHPNGYFDAAKRWYPDESEKCQECESIREPSYRFPNSKMVHCRTLKHIMSKYNVKSENGKFIKRICKEYKEKVPELEVIAKGIGLTLADLFKPKSIQFIKKLASGE